MKKALLAFAMFAGIAFGASAQCTVDTTHFTSTKYSYPDTFACITRNTTFSGTVSIKVPSTADAHDFFSQAPAGSVTATIDSMRITSVTGYPAALTGAGPALNTWLHGGDIRCFQISGTETDAAGNYPLTITGDICAHAVILTFPYSTCQNSVTLSRFYSVSLKVCDPAGIAEVLSGVDLSIYPNPNQGAFTVNVATDDRIAGDMMVMDALGRTVHTQSIDVTGTRQIAMDLGNISSGVYMLVISTANGKSVKQFTVK